jgi:ankyrin repeat protein
VLELLIENGADITVEDKFGQTCFFYAIREGHAEIIEYLIKTDPSKIDKTDKKGITPYMFAVKHGKTKIAEMLKEYGAKTEIPSQDKKSKSKKTKQSTNTNNNIEIAGTKTEEEPKAKKYILVKVNENGEKVPLSSKEIEEFEANFPVIMDYLKNPETLEELEKNAPEE